MVGSLPSEGGLRVELGGGGGEIPSSLPYIVMSWDYLWCLGRGNIHLFTPYQRSGFRTPLIE